MMILDASNPRQPIELSHINLEDSDRLVLKDEKIYYYNSRDGAFRSVNVGNPHQPIFTRFSYQPQIDLGYFSFIAEAIYLIITTRGPEHSGVLVVNTIHGIRETYLEMDENVHMEPVIVDDYMYVPAGNDGVFILDVSNMINQVEIGQFEVPGEALYVAVEGDLLCVANGNLSVYNIEDRENPELLSVFDPPDSTLRIQMMDGYVYLGLGRIFEDRISRYIRAVSILDLADPSNPVEVAYGGFPHSIYNFHVEPPYIYTTEQHGLGVYECSEVVGVSPDRENLTPQTTILHPAYPNPFNSFTTLKYHLTSPATVKIGIFDSRGRQVLDVTGQRLKYPGIHTEIIDACGLPSGLYHAFLKAGDVWEVAPLVLVK